MLKRLARDKHSNLLWKSVNYGRNKFYGTGPRSSNFGKTSAFYQICWQWVDALSATFSSSTISVSFLIYFFSLPGPKHRKLFLTEIDSDTQYILGYWHLYTTPCFVSGGTVSNVILGTIMGAPLEYVLSNLCVFLATLVLSIERFFKTKINSNTQYILSYCHLYTTRCFVNVLACIINIIWL